MATVIFDTLELTNLLKLNSFSAEQAEAVIKVITKAQEGLVTKDYFDYRLKEELVPLKEAQIKTDGKLNLIQWMLALVIIVNVIPNLAKIFSH